MSELKAPDQHDVLVEVIINGRDVLQFYSTQEYYKTLYEDREALINTVKTAFTEGVLTSVDVKNVEDIQSVKFLSEIVEETVEVSNPVEEIQVEGEFEEYEVIEEPAVENLTSSEYPEEVVIDVGLTPGADDRLNVCPVCTYRTFNVGHFKIHMRQHTGESPYECNFCDYKSKQKSNLKRHMKHHLEGKDHFECKMCDFTCSQEKVFKRHMVLHSRSKPLRACPFCDYYSTSLAHLTVHIRQHTGETPYHCGLCSYKTVQKSNLTRHLKKHRRGRVSKADKLRCCVYCSYRTPNPAHLLAHIRAAHTGETPYACNMCDYKSAQRSNLKRHLRKHSGERPFRCHLCKYSTAYPYVLKKHIENHPTVENLQCPQCDFVTNSTAESKRHARIHSGKTLFCCDICGYLSLNSDHLKAHLRSHSKEKPYKCHFCTYCSVQKSNLKRHLLFKHSGIARKRKSIHTPHSAEDQLDNDDKSSEGNLHMDNSDENYMDVENDNIQSQQGVKEEPFECETILETADAVAAGDPQFVNSNATESMNDANVASEEHIVTSVVAEGEFEVVEEYADGVVVNGATVECMSVEQEVEGPQKPKLDFLNKSQTEKLKEFKRLLQEGTQFSQSGSQPRIREAHSRKRSANCLEEKKSSYSEDHHFNEEMETSYSTPDTLPSGQGEVEEAVVESGNEMRVDHVEEHSLGKSFDSTDPTITRFSDSSILIVDRPKETPYQNDNEESELYENSFYEEEYLEDEENTNDGNRDELCELCGYKASSRSELKLHISVHTGEAVTNVFKCDLCAFKSIRKNDLGRHNTLIHGATPPRMLPFICAICNFRSDSKENLLIHCQTHSNCMVKCKICEEKCKTPLELTNHCKKHIGEEPFECYFCGYLTARKYQLRKHIRRKHSTDEAECAGMHYKCYTCGYQTDLRRDFHKHRGEHKMESEVPKGYKCPHCLFYCFDNKVLDTHLKAHSAGDIPTANNVEALENISPGIDMEVEGRRTPLKEFPSNASGSDNMWTKQTSSKLGLLNASSRKFLREDFTPVKKRRRGLKSLLLGNRHGGSSLIEERLNRKFNFDVKNLCPSDEENECGFDIELSGEVVKSHGSLRKYTNYGEIINKSKSELATVMANIDNEEHLKIVFEQIKQLESRMLADEDLEDIEFTIFFKDIDDCNLKTNNESISDIDDILSSEDESDLLNDDTDLLLSDSDTDLLSDNNSLQFESKPYTASKSTKESVKKESSKPQVLFNLDELDEAHLKEKIMEQNRRRGELRRQKILSLSNSTKPTNGTVKRSKYVKGQEEDDENKLIIDE